MSGELVIEAVEEDSLAALHEALDVRTAEIEMPRLWRTLDCVPWIDAGDRRVHHHETLDLVGIARGVGIRHHIADVVSYDRAAVKTQGQHHRAQVRRLGPLVVAA